MIAKEGRKIILILFFLAIFSRLVGNINGFEWMSFVYLISGLFFLFSLIFFRDPKRNIPAGDNSLVSPADGKIINVEQVNDPDVGKAAVKIQAGFKGHQARKQVKEMKEENPEKENTDIERKEIDFDDEEVILAIIEIQAGFRGYQARREVNNLRTQKKPGLEDEEIDIDLEDPEVGKAALKIQSGFKHKKFQKMLTNYL